MARWLLVVVALLALVALATYWAGEQTEVAVLRTFDPDGATHDTKLWVVDIEGVPWVRVGRPARGWLLRLEADPRAELVREGRATPRRAVVVRDPDARRRVDEAFAGKYGVVDWWYGVVLRSDPVPVRLDPVRGPS